MFYSHTSQTKAETNKKRFFWEIIPIYIDVFTTKKDYSKKLILSFRIFAVIFLEIII